MRIEIGTNDFDTMAGKEHGIYIEPVKYYFDKLEKSDNCHYENIAISNRRGKIEVFYLTEDQIRRRGLPKWARGCCSVNQPHPTLLGLNVPPEDFKVDKVKVSRIKTIINKYEVKEISILKLDTEGCDVLILNDFLDTVSILPEQIKFENNALSDADEVNNLIKRLTKLGYSCVKHRFDVLCKLNKKK